MREALPPNSEVRLRAIWSVRIMATMVTTLGVVAAVIFLASWELMVREGPLAIAVGLGVPLSFVVAGLTLFKVRWFSDTYVNAVSSAAPTSGSKWTAWLRVGQFGGPVGPWAALVLAIGMLLGIAIIKAGIVPVRLPATLAGLLFVYCMFLIWNSCSNLLLTALVKRSAKEDGEKFRSAMAESRSGASDAVVGPWPGPGRSIEKWPAFGPILAIGGAFAFYTLWLLPAPPSRMRTLFMWVAVSTVLRGAWVSWRQFRR